MLSISYLLQHTQNGWNNDRHHSEVTKGIKQRWLTAKIITATMFTGNWQSWGLLQLHGENQQSQIHFET